MGRRLILELQYDQDCPSPEEDSGWKLYSFRRGSGVDPYRFIEPYSGGKPASIGLRRKLAVGSAFWLSCYEHGIQVWALYGEGPTIDRRWDYTYLAGILVWEGSLEDLPKGLEARRRDARAFLDTYNDWCSGSCYGYVLSDGDGNEIDNCWGFIGADSGMAEFVNGSLEEGDELVVEGEAAELAKYLNLKARIVDGEIELARRLRG